MEKEKTEKKILNFDEIIKEGESIYPVCESSDKKCEENHNIINFAEMFYHIKKDKMKERFINLMSKSEHKMFFEALNYEYGINNINKDLKKAYNIYKEAADKTNDTMSMFRMYHLYKKDFIKFGFSKRNRVYEKYYILKCMAYLEGREIENLVYLCNRFAVLIEVAYQFQEEDLDFKKFDKFIEYLSKYRKELKIDLNNILIIKGVIKLKLYYIPSENLIISTFTAPEIKTDLEAIYKTAYFLASIKNELAEKYFEILYSKKYYRSYIDYAVYLFTIKKDTTKALNLLEIAYKNGIRNAGDVYYDIYFCSKDFEKLMTDTNSINIIFNILIDNISTEDTYYYFEYLFLSKIITKHFGLKDLLDKLTLDYTKELVQFILEITNENSGNKKQLIKQYFQREIFYCEFHLVCGALYYYGFGVEKNLEKSLEKFKISFKNNESLSYRRFLYSFICFTRQKLFNNNNNSIKIEKLEKSRKKLFNLCEKSIKSEEEFPSLSSSFFYFYAKLLNKKIGNEGDLLMEFICLKKASERPLDIPGCGSILSYYRKYKSSIKLKKEEKKKFKGIFDNIKGFNDCEGYEEDDSLCPICYEQKREVICLPCKHLFCETCIGLINLNNCPICRQHIIHTFNIGKNK